MMGTSHSDASHHFLPEVCMANRDSDSLSSSEDDPQLYQSWVAELNRSWGDDRLAALVEQLPAAGSLRRAALIELVLADMQQRWQRGHQLKTEVYLKIYPELGTPAEAPVELIQAEWVLRHQHGAPADLDDFLRRFPSRGEELDRL